MELEKAWFRPAACYLFAVRKMKKKEIAEIFGVDPHTVARAINRHEETGEHKNWKGQGRKRTARSDENIEQVRELLQENNHTKKRNGVAGRSTRKIGKKLRI